MEGSRAKTVDIKADFFIEGMMNRRKLFNLMETNEEKI